MSPEDLVSLADLARTFGVTKRTALRYANRPDFPEALGQTAAGRVWLRRDVEQWGKAHLPLPRPGRPRKQPPDADA